MKTITDYTNQAQGFLDSTDTRFEVEFIEYGIHFDDDKDRRDIYKIILSRNNRQYSFKFGQSINCSGRFWLYGDYKRGVSNGKSYKLANGKPSKIFRPPMALGEGLIWDKNRDFKPPTAYDVLACLQKHDPRSFEDFCCDFAYDTDSRKAEKTYNAVKNEYDNLKMLYSDEELELMSEIN